AGNHLFQVVERAPGFLLGRWYLEMVFQFHRCLLHAPAARSTARLVSTVARWRRYSSSPFRSALGLVPSAAPAQARAMADSSTAHPATACSTAEARSGTESIFVSATRASA